MPRGISRAGNQQEEHSLDSMLPNPNLRDWSLITGRGATKREGGGACEVLPLRKGGGMEKVLAMLKGGGAQKVLR